MSASLPEETQQATEVEILLFEIGSELFGADASQVLRVDRAAVDALEIPTLGRLRSGARALVFLHQGGERQVRIDTVHGVRTAALTSLRRIPAVASAAELAIGVWLDGQRAVMLVDLVQAADSVMAEA